MRELLDERGLSYRALAVRTHYGKSLLQEVATGQKVPTVEAARRIDEALDAGGALAALVQRPPAVEWDDDELDALELSRRVAASDVGAETLDRLEAAVDDLASAYPKAPPGDLLCRVRRHLAYVGKILDSRKTLDEHRRLLVAGGWLSLLAATVRIDLRKRSAAEANLKTARQMAEHADHAEIQAWCLETHAWHALIRGDYQRALDLSRRAQELAPRGSSVQIQTTAQEGRAWARMGKPAETRAALDRVSRLVSPLPVPERPEHHYVYDPAKALSYTATTLAGH